MNLQIKIKRALRKLGFFQNDYKIFWSSNKYLAGKNWDNFGDALVPYLIEKISNKNVVWTRLKASNSKFKIPRKVYVVIGSILEQANSNTIVWGAGIMNSKSNLKKAKYISVRGPISYSRVIANGYKMKKNWGDPALLLPFYYSVPKKVKRNVITIIPHYVDFEFVNNHYSKYEGIEVLDLTDSNLEGLIDSIATSKFVFSSSLHGLIVAHAYGVEALWVMFSDKLDGDDIKFYDYFMSLNITIYKPWVFDEKLLDLSFIHDSLLPDSFLLQQIQLGLIDSCPFIKK